MCKIQIEQSYFRFSFSDNTDNNTSRRLRPRAARRTKSLPRHILLGPPRHSASTGGPGRRIYAELLPQIDARADEGQRRKKPRRRPTRLPARDLLCPRDTCHSAAKIPKLLHVLHTDRGHPRHAELHCVAGAQLLCRHIAQRLLGRRAGRWCIGSRRGRGWHGYVPSAAAGGLLHTGQISDEQEQGGQTSSERFEKEVRVFAECGKIKFQTRRPPPPFIHRARRFGKPAIQQYGVNQRSCQKPSRNHFERGQRLHHLATPSAPDDLVELVPRRANVGAKAKTLPFARCLRQSHCTNGDDDRQSSLFVRHAEGRRPMARSPHPAASPNTGAHVQSGPS
jgi:hypothetical protein